ncbi:MetQ/NlpA family ABC transporter substrate-binding protein [Dolosigranulum savutiense]|uniref:Lipoprotein n=1 Tax=Dolosigranulum savutiense TaxID=3110288 RepID=A0AB74TQJ0_9LACT
MNFKHKLLTLLGLFALILAACTTTGDNGTTDKAADSGPIKIGVVGEDNDVWEHVQDKLAQDGITIEIVTFSDYNQPNKALAEKEIDLNSFQHKIYLDNYNEEHGTDIVPLADTFIAPLGIYSEKITDISEIKDGDKVSIPNDVTNGGRALLLLQTAGLIEVDPAAGHTPTLDDITDNPHNLEITELDASQTARSLSDVTIALINSGMAVDAGYIPTEDAIFLEPVDESSDPYVNIIAANNGDNRDVFQKIIDAFQTDDVVELNEEISKGSSIAVWD